MCVHCRVGFLPPLVALSFFPSKTPLPFAHHRLESSTGIVIFFYLMDYVPPIGNFHIRDPEKIGMVKFIII